MSFVFDPEPQVAVPVAGSTATFPVRRIYCVGRNYAAHAREMGFDPDREPPFFFCKPASSIVVVPGGATVDLPYPSQTQDYQHEIELVVAIGRAGRDIAVEHALDHVWGYGVGLDMTRRDLQIKSRDKGRPVGTGQGLRCVGADRALHAVAEVGHPATGSIWLEVDGVDAPTQHARPS